MERWLRDQTVLQLRLQSLLSQLPLHQLPLMRTTAKEKESITLNLKLQNPLLSLEMRPIKCLNQLTIKLKASKLANLLILIFYIFPQLICHVNEDCC